MLNHILPIEYQSRHPLILNKMKYYLSVVFALTGVLNLMTIETNAQEHGSINPSDKGHLDFDFAIGSWSVAHRRLNNVFSETDDWIEFVGTSTTRKILGGFGNLEENVLHFPDSSFNAIAIRSYNKDTKQWSIWWLDGRFPGSIDTPVIGRFEDGIGVFVADDFFEGLPIKVKFTWNATDPMNPIWKQAFSRDEGATWKTNWVMSFTQDNNTQ